MSGALTTATVVRTDREDARRRAFRIVNPLVPPVSPQQEGRGPQSPFFPSSADTNVKGIIPANFFLTSRTCERR